jgi:hypothetical protein
MRREAGAMNSKTTGNIYIVLSYISLFLYCLRDTGVDALTWTDQVSKTYSVWNKSCCQASLESEHGIVPN